MLSITVSRDSALVSWKVRTIPWRATLCDGHATDRLALEGPGALVGRVEAGQQVEEGRLAGTVRADERGDDPPLDLEVVDVDGLQAAEAPLRRRR